MHHVLRPAAVAVAIAVALAGCADDEKTPAEARRDRVEARLQASFSDAQVACMLDRLDTPALRALDSQKTLDLSDPGLATFSEAATACVTDPDGSSTTTAGAGAASTTTTTAPKAATSSTTGG